MSHFAFVAFLVLFVALRWRAQARRAVAPPAHPPVSLVFADAPPVRPAVSHNPIEAADESPADVQPARPRGHAMGAFYRTVYGPGLCSPR